MSLKSIQYQEDYRTGHDDILNDFFRMSLKSATIYWRAVGYFSSSALETFGRPLDDFINNEGTIRLITSVELRAEDFKAIKEGLSKREVCEARIKEILDEQFSGQLTDGVSRLLALLKAGRLEMKIASPKDAPGIYHEKVGVFFSSDDEYVSFIGSTNESQTAFESNYESLDVYPSWEVPSRALRKKEHFEELWNNVDVGAEVYDFPEALRKDLIRICDENRKRTASKPAQNKWRHQDEALKNFLAAERGVLNMATGTGKTRTAFKIVDELLRRDLVDTVIISTAGNDLLSQWYGETLSYFSKNNIPLRVYRSFENHRDGQKFLVNPVKAAVIASRGKVAPCLKGLSPAEGQRTVLIHDEVHGLGSPSCIRDLASLSDHIRFRLGLSATPERMYDQDGNAFIASHIGPEIMSFGLEDAIQRGILTEFNYHPLHYRISKEDKKDIANVYARQAARNASGSPMSDEEVWIEISKVYKCSIAKLPPFKEFIDGKSELLERCIIFVETMDYGRKVLDIVHKHRPDFHTYFSGEDSGTLQRFANSELECLVTCHRLSEGIDIQSLKNVILFSSARARLETIQRMGRCLRTDPNNPLKRANIVDFIRIEDEPGATNSDLEREAWLTTLSKVKLQEV